MNQYGHENVDCDHQRESRTGIPEVVFAKFKDPEGLLQSIHSLLDGPKGRVLVTKATTDQQSLIKKTFKSLVTTCDSISGTIIIEKEGVQKADKTLGKVVVLAAGTSDHFVAEEAAISAEFFGLDVTRKYDCGVAGMHRVKEACMLASDANADCIIVVAGMEGALPSVIASQVRQPIIAVPTSVGYGASFSGITPLLGMLNSCSPGVAVVNIDNGFGAAAAAYKMVAWMNKRPNDK